jgi:hypothetical protein
MVVMGSGLQTVIAGWVAIVLPVARLSRLFRHFLKDHMPEIAPADTLGMNLRHFRAVDYIVRRSDYKRRIVSLDILRGCRDYFGLQAHIQ